MHTVMQTLANHVAVSSQINLHTALVLNIRKEERNMAVILKSRQEIAGLREAGRIVAETFEVLRPYVVPGTTTAELDRIAEDFIRAKGAKPIYKGYGARVDKKGQVV